MPNSESGVAVANNSLAQVLVPILRSGQQLRLAFVGGDGAGAAEHIERLKKLQEGDIYSYLKYLESIKNVEIERVRQESTDAPWNYWKFENLVFRISDFIQSLYTRALAFNWLKQNAEEIHKSPKDFAESRGIKPKFIDTEGELYKVAAVHNWNEILRVEKLLYKKYRFFTHPSTQISFILPPIVPEWVAFVIGLTYIEIPVNYPTHLQIMLSASPYTLVDRAVRDGRNWQFGDEVNPFPTYSDGNNGLTLSYDTRETVNDDVKAAAELAIVEVSKLDDRTADVWRIILWKALEHGPAAEFVFGRIQLDTREIVQLLGHKKHHKGGVKPEHLLNVQEALHHLERLRIYMDASTRGTLERDAGQGKGKRKKAILQRAREEKIISVMAREVERDLFGKTCHMVWEIALGDWAQFWPRSYAPIAKALVQLPAKAKWAKRIGTELMLHYREDAKSGEQVKKLKWRTILTRAGLMMEVQEMRERKHTSRVKGYAEKALEQLQEMSVLEKWQIREADLKALNDSEGKPGHFEQWLDSVVEIHAPQDVFDVLETITVPKPPKVKKTKAG